MNDSESEDLHASREPIGPVKKEPVARPSSRPSSSRRPRSAGKNLRINTPLSSPTPRPRTESTITVVQATTPTQANSRNIPLPPDSQVVNSTATERPHTPHLRRISSGASVSALKGASPTPPASATTQESMSSAGVPIQPTNNITIRPPSSMTTDNDEDDFQSAYSTSPRGEQFSASQLSGSDQDSEWVRQNTLPRQASKSEKRQTFGGVDTVHGGITPIRSRASSVNTIDVVKTTVA
jgi:hypothetical protein